jgi:hypothetical protein
MMMAASINPTSGRVSAMAPAARIIHTTAIITITDANTTIGYCRYDCSGEIEYLFVSVACQRSGYALLMLEIVERSLGCRLRFQPPLSPLGARLLHAYEREAGGNDRGVECGATETCSSAADLTRVTT